MYKYRIDQLMSFTLILLDTLELNKGFSSYLV